MKKLITLFLTATLLICLVACNNQTAVLDEVKTYEITADIHSLNIQINAADFKIKSGDKFLIESNLKYLSVSDKDGVLSAFDEAKSNSNYSNAFLTLYVPNGTVFDEAIITTGAAKLTADILSASSIKLALGAGDVHFNILDASLKATINGGAGQITINSGNLNNLALNVGVGELNLTAAVLGDSKLEFGIGESNVTLIGSKNDYKVDIEKGVGNITVDGTNVTDFGSSGNGQNYIKINGGVGSINLKFQQNLS